MESETGLKRYFAFCQNPIFLKDQNIIISHINFPCKISIGQRAAFSIIIPHMNFPYKTSIDERQIFGKENLLSIPNTGVLKDTGHHLLRITVLLYFARGGPHKLMKRNI